MKILGLVVIIAYFSFCTAQTNRTTVWLLADEIVYSAKAAYQACSNRLGGTTNTSLLTTSYFRISTGSSQDAFYIKTLDDDGTVVGATYYLKSLQLIFTYGDSTTPNIVFNLASFSTLAPSTTGTYFNFLTNSIPTGTYTSASGAAWLSVRTVSASNYPNIATGAAAAGTIASASVLITDYRSRSTIAVIQYQEGNDISNTNLFNHVYSIIVRTPTSLLTSSSDILVAGCTGSRTAPGANQLTPVITSPTCASNAASATDSSLSSATTICTDAGLPDAVNVAVTAMSALRTQDNQMFSKAGSKFTIAVNSGVLIAMSSIIFSLSH